MSRRTLRLDEQEYAEQFARVLHLLRTQCGWSQTEMANQLGCDNSLLSRLESARAVPTREFVERLIERMRLPSWDADAVRLAAGYAPKTVGRPLEVASA